MEPSDPPNHAVQLALALLVLFMLSVAAALAVALLSRPPPVGLLATAVVAPILVLVVVSIHRGRLRRVRGFVIGGDLGAVGVGLWLAIRGQPNLEVGGDIPDWISAVSIIPGILVSFTSLDSILELRAPRVRRCPIRRDTDALLDGDESQRRPAGWVQSMLHFPLPSRDGAT